MKELYTLKYFYVTMLNGGPRNGASGAKGVGVLKIQSIDRMIDWIVLLFYAVSAIFQPRNGGSF